MSRGVAISGAGVRRTQSPAGPQLPALVWPGVSWATETDETLGVDTALLDAWVSTMGGSGFVAYRGYRVREWGSTAKIDWASGRKPLIGALLLHMIEDGHLSGLDARFSDLGHSMTAPDVPMTLRQTATFTSGYARAEDPGERYAYNNVGLRLLSVTMDDPGLAHLGGSPINRLRTYEGQKWGALNFEGAPLFTIRGGHGISASPAAVARWCIWWMRQGEWDGQQLLPASYWSTVYDGAKVAASLPLTVASDSDYLGVGTDGGTSADDDGGAGPGRWGHLMWFNGQDSGGARLWPSADPGWAAGDGNFGARRFAMLPSKDLAACVEGAWGAWAPGSVGSAMDLRMAELEAVVP